MLRIGFIIHYLIPFTYDSTGMTLKNIRTKNYGENSEIRFRIIRIVMYQFVSLQFLTYYRPLKNQDNKEKLKKDKKMPP